MCHSPPYADPSRVGGLRAAQLEGDEQGGPHMIAGFFIRHPFAIHLHSGL